MVTVRDLAEHGLRLSLPFDDGTNHAHLRLDGVPAEPALPAWRE